MNIPQRQHVTAPLWLRCAFALGALTGCSDDDAASTARADSPTEQSDDSAQKADAGTKVARDTRDTGGNKESGGMASAGAGASKSASKSATPKSGTTGECAGETFGSTYEAIQKVIFEGYHCADSKCHGEAKVGGLDLRPEVAYDNLVQVKAKNGTQWRILPGVPAESFFYNKLRAATSPGSVKVDGSPMPVGGPALTADHLEAVRLWIEAGAPRDGSVGDHVTGRSDQLAQLLGSCLPKASPIQITALPPPEKSEGVQLSMPPFTLPAGTEVDVCFAQYVDLTDVVPKEFQDPEKGIFFVNGQRVRQDPHSHHFTLIQPDLGADVAHDPSFGKWECRGGDKQGESCDPIAAGACGKGQCASEVKDTAACIGFGPQVPGASRFARNAVATAQSAQYYRAPRDGVYETFPLKGILYWNSHAFNLTAEPTDLDVWVNFFYAKDRQHLIKTIGVANNISIAAGQAPFTIKNYCANWVAPQNARMYQLGTHTHKRGRNFTVDLWDGTRIYQSAVYSDPLEKLFDPPMVFDSSDPAKRTLKYCADFNNGVRDDGTPDVDLVTRLSTMPSRTTCKPVACVSGKVGAACDGPDDDDACDSSEGAGDGSCDACPITGGQTTENEMFVLSPSIVTD